MSTNATNISMESIRTGLETFCVNTGKKCATAIPIISGSIKMPDMLMNKSKKLISNSLILSRRPGRVDDQNMKLSGVVKKAVKEVMAVSVTESATLPFAKNEKKLDAFPPGQAATSIIPSATPGGGDSTKMITIVSKGSKRYCDTMPVRSAFF